MNVILASCTGSQAKKKVPAEDPITSQVEETVQDQAQSVSLNPDHPTVNIRPHQVIQSEANIKVNSEGKWFGFEAELGTAALLSDGGETLGMCILSTTENWMVKGPVLYNCNLSYNSPSAGSGKLVIKNNNPTGDVEHDASFEIPVTYASTQ